MFVRQLISVPLPQQLYPAPAIVTRAKILLFVEEKFWSKIQNERESCAKPPSGRNTGEEKAKKPQEKR
jgi:hypothetical protein